MNLNRLEHDQTIWNPARTQIREWFHNHAPTLGDMYQGAVMLLLQHPIPGKGRFITHAMREIINNLPRSLRINVKERFDSTKAIRRLQQKWEEKGKICLSDGQVTVNIDVDLFQSISELIEDFRQSVEVNSRDRAHKLFESFRDAGVAVIGLAPVVKQWIELYDWCMKQVHLPGLNIEDVESKELEEKFEVFENTLLAFFGAFYTTIDELDAILNAANNLPWTSPTARQIAETRSLLAKVTYYRYFFNQLRNPAWLKPLREIGFFKIVPDFNGESDSFTFWPESHYLLRMSKYPDFLEVIVEIVESLLPIKDQSVLGDILQLISFFHKDMAEKVLPKVLESLKVQRFYFNLPKHVAELCLFFLKNGYPSSAIALAEKLFAPADNNTVKFGTSGWDQLNAKFEIWEYQRLLNELIPVFSEYAGLPALHLFIKLTDSSLWYLAKDREDKNRDFSWIWHPSIEERKQGSHREISSILLTALRDIAEPLVVDCDSKIRDDVYLALERKKWPTFLRLRLHLARIELSVDSNRATCLLRDHSLFNKIDVRPEYALLLRDTFNILSSKDIETILHWIQEESYQYVHEEVEDKERTLRIKSRQCSWLRPLRHLLPSTEKERLEQLEYELASVECSIDNTSTIMFSEDLSVMPASEIIKQVEHWKSQIGTMEELPFDFSIHISRRIMDEPEQFVARAFSFAITNADYITKLFSAFREAIKSRKKFELGQLLELARWVVEHPRTDLQWSYARTSVMRLLIVGMDDEKSFIGIEQRELVWSIIIQALKDFNPTPEYEAIYGEGADPLNISINTARGEALHAALQYGCWVRNHQSYLKPVPTFDMMPELRITLEKYLDTDLSIVFRAALGHWLLQLFVLDEDWTIQHLGEIFPSNEGKEHLWDAVWVTYLAKGELYDKIFGFLSNQYFHAISQLTKEDLVERKGSTYSLFRHLIIAYGRELIGIEQNGLLDKFFSVAPLLARQKAIEFIGSSIRGEEIPSELLNRFVDLWAWRRQANRNDGELAGIGAWVTSNKFEPAWVLRELTNILKTHPKMEIRIDTLCSLQKLVATEPVLVIECLHLLFQRNNGPLLIVICKNEIKEIISEAKAYGANKECNNLINFMGELGYFEFRSFIN